MVRVIEEPRFRNKVHIFDDRFHAGKLLAEKLVEYKDEKDIYILTIPSGGVPIAFMVSKILRIPMDLVITRKIHIPWNKEAGFGAISWDGVVFLNESLIFSLGLTKEEIARCVVEEKEIIRKRLKLFRGNRPFPNFIESKVIVMDDGLASGYSMLTTVKTLQKQKIMEIVVAVPTAPITSIELVKPYVDKIICLNIRSGPFFAVADAYKKWSDLKDEDVIKILTLIKWI